MMIDKTLCVRVGRNSTGESDFKKRYLLNIDYKTIRTSRKEKRSFYQKDQEALVAIG